MNFGGDADTQSIAQAIPRPYFRGILRQKIDPSSKSLSAIDNIRMGSRTLVSRTHYRDSKLCIKELL